MAMRFMVPALITAFCAIILGLLLRAISGRRSRNRAVGFFHPYTQTTVAAGRGCYGAPSEPSKMRALTSTALCTPEITMPHLEPLIALGSPCSALPSFVQRRLSLQLEAFSTALKRLDSSLPKPRLQFVGSCRNKSDEERLQNLKEKAIELNVNEQVEFYKNITYRDLVGLLAGAVGGIHSMTDEHFGISVVEYMAAGAIPIAHNSAGPKMDIILDEDGQQTGFLACTVEEYADAILRVIRIPEIERLKMADAARRRARRFSEQKFYDDFKDAVRPVLHPHSR